MKKYLILAATLLIMAFVANSCSTPDAYMKSMVGHNISEVIYRMGPATTVQPDGQGGATYTWSYLRSGYTAWRMFMVDANGTIYAYRYQGL